MAKGKENQDMKIKSRNGIQTKNNMRIGEMKNGTDEIYDEVARGKKKKFRTLNGKMVYVQWNEVKKNNGMK